MERLVYIDTFHGAKRRVLVENGIPVEIALSSDDQNAVGNIYIGRVEKVLPHVGSAFVNIGVPKNAFLPLSEAISPGGETLAEADRPPIRQGHEIIVQVTKSAYGDKGARLTMNPSFPGKYCVLLPSTQTIGISRHIQDPERREALLRVAKNACPAGCGLLIRTAAAEENAQQILDEAKSLHEKWTLLATRAKSRKAPTMIFDGGNLLEGIERDMDATIFEQPLPDVLEEKLKKALRRKVWLNSGAYLVIDPCEAMTVIDINSGKFISKSEMPEAILKINREAALEAAKQIRLRDVGGIIVIDFIDMQNDSDREEVLKAFEGAMENDRAKRHIHGFTATGLLELTRRSVYQPFLFNRCPHCMGTGYQEI